MNMPTMLFETSHEYDIIPTTCQSGGMVYTSDSKSLAVRLEGSSPSFGTDIDFTPHIG